MLPRVVGEGCARRFVPAGPDPAQEAWEAAMELASSREEAEAEGVRFTFRSYKSACPQLLEPTD